MNDDIIIGTVDFTNPIEKIIGPSKIEEAFKLKIDKLGECFIKIKSSEGPIPHFHIDNKDGKTICCVCIYVPEYFHHKTGEKDLTNEQKAILDIAMEEHWDELDKQWRAAYASNNPTEFKRYINKHNLNMYNLKKPDYNLLP